MKSAATPSKVARLADYQRKSGGRPDPLTTLTLEYVPRERRKFALLFGSSSDNLAYLSQAGFEMVVAIEANDRGLHLPGEGRGIYYVEKPEKALIQHDGQPIISHFNMALCLELLLSVKKKQAYQLLEQMYNALRPGGVMTFVLRGENDDSASFRGPTFFTRSEIIALKALYPPLPERYRGLERDGVLPNGEPHHFHRHTFICQKAE